MTLRSIATLHVLFSIACQAQDYLANNPIWQVHSTCAVPYPCIANDDYT